MLLPWNTPDRRLRHLATRAQRGDREAFRELYRELFPLVSRYIGRRVIVKSDAEDLISTTFERMLAGLSGLDPKRVVAFALGIARNAVIDHFRLRRPAAPLEAAAAVPATGDPLGQLSAREGLHALSAAFAHLTDDERELVSLRFGDGLRHAEIAALLGLSEPAVRQRLSRAVRELRATALAYETQGGPLHGPQEA
jgi:RNA polymerase sigma-70 factor, ECF subfamily